MTEQERLKAIETLMDWSRQDDTVKEIIRVVCQQLRQPAIGHLARYCPDDFDLLFEEAEAIMLNET